MSDLAPYFEDDSQREAYERFCAEQERGLEGFQLDAPALVCRWRMAKKHVPLLNRHIRALLARRVLGKPVSRNLAAWAKQHIEWSLAEGSYPQADGVLMLVIDVNGNAAMSVGDYEALPSTSREALAARAANSRAEAGETGVAPELLCAVAADGAVLMAAGEDEALCGTATLVEQLARTCGHGVRRVSGLAGPSKGGARAGGNAAFFLLSDEHGIVPARENADGADADAAAFVEFLSAGRDKLYGRRLP